MPSSCIVTSSGPVASHHPAWASIVPLTLLLRMVHPCAVVSAWGLTNQHTTSTHEPAGNPAARDEPAGESPAPAVALAPSI